MKKKKKKTGVNNLLNKIKYCFEIDINNHFSVNKF